MRRNDVAITGASNVVIDHYYKDPRDRNRCAFVGFKYCSQSHAYR